MKNLNHTPGPWKCDDKYTIYADSTGWTLADTWTRNVNKPECHAERWANARLIAAAPEMLDALIGAVNLSTRDGWLCKMFSPVIEKATGKSIEEILK